MPVHYLEASSDSPSIFGEGDGGDSDSMMSTASSDSMATLNRLHDELERAFGKRRRRAAVPLTKIYYPHAPGGHGQRQAGHQPHPETFLDFAGDDINMNMGPDPYPYSRYRSAPGTGAVGGGGGSKGAGRWGGFTRYTPRGTYGSSGVYSGLAEARLGAMQGQLMRWAAQREVTRENLSRHGNWLSTFKADLGRASHTHYGGGKENAGMGMGMPTGEVSSDYAAGAKGGTSGERGDGTTKIALGDGKAIVIRIESLLP